MMLVKSLRSFVFGAAASLSMLALADAQVPRATQDGVGDTVLDDAKLKGDSGLKEVLQQASDLAQQGRYDLACVLWQKVIDEYRGQVFTRDEWKETTSRNSYQKYRSVTGEVELLLAALPADGLSTYRRKADGEALALMTAAGSKNRERALAEVVSRYFLSKLGDEAAFELACLKLDRQEFLPAARLLTKIVSEYPDPTVPLSEINLRLAAVHARTGDAASARAMIGALKEEEVPQLPIAVIKLVEKDIEDQLARRALTVDKKSDWTMRHGGPSRSGVMPAPAKDLTLGLVQGWRQGYSLTFPSGPEWDAMRDGEKELARQEAAARFEVLSPRTVINRRASENPAAIPVLNKKIIKDWRLDGWQPLGQATRLRSELVLCQETIGKWKEDGWRPVGQVLMNEGRVYFKTHDRVVCCDADTGELHWFGYRSEYPKDPPVTRLSTNQAEVVLKEGRSVPFGEREVMNFSDSRYQSMSLVGDKLAVIQGKPINFDEADDSAVAAAGGRRVGEIGGGLLAMDSGGRARDNRLFVHHAKSGRLLWMTRASKLIPDSFDKVSFAGSPVPYGPLMIVPVYESTSLWLFGLNSNTGEVLWKSFLADEPKDQTAKYSPVQIAVDGGDAFVATGAGLIASIDAIGGSLNWVVAYPRTALAQAEIASSHPRFGNTTKFTLDGWDDDTIISSGNRLVLAPSDFNFMVALDRGTGKVAWDTARTPAKGAPASEYVLGISGDVICVAGKAVVRGYSLEDGRALWERKLDEISSGRGMLTAAGIYLPLKKSILHLSALDGEVIAEIPVNPAMLAGLLGSIQTELPPLGSLYTDGDRVFEVGFRQIRSLRFPEIVDGDESAGNEAASEHEKLANELLGMLIYVYGELWSVTDVDSIWSAGQALHNGSSKLTKIAERMQDLGAPDEATRQVIETMFVQFQIGISDQMTKGITQVLKVSESVGNEVLLELIGLHRKAGTFPILNEYGIDLSFRDGK